MLLLIYANINKWTNSNKYKQSYHWFFNSPIPQILIYSNSAICTLCCLKATIIIMCHRPKNGSQIYLKKYIIKNTYTITQSNKLVKQKTHYNNNHNHYVTAAS